MKKVISLILCVMLVIGVMATAVSAVDYKIDARFLRDYGQVVYFVDAPVATAPNVDGKVLANEYTLKEEATMDEFSEKYHATGGTWGVEGATFYLAYDADYLYMAAEVKDNAHTVHGQWPDNRARADQLGIAIGGMYDTADPMGIGSTLDFRFFDGNGFIGTDETKGQWEDFAEGQDMEKDFFNTPVGTALDVDTYIQAHKVVHDDTTGVTTYEVALKWSAIKAAWPHLEGQLQYDLLTFGFYIQDTSDEEIVTAESVMGNRTGISYWGISGEQATAAYEKLAETYDSAAFYGRSDKEGIIPYMVYFGTEEEYLAYQTASLVEDVPETETPDTDPTVTDDTPTGDDKPSGDDPTGGNTGDDKAEAGCGGSVAAMGVALVAVLGTCTVFVAKKRD